MRKIGHLARDFVRDDGDDPHATQRHERQGECVVAGKHAEARRDGGQDFHLLHDAPGGLLDADDVGDFREAGHGGGLDIRRGA